MSEMSAPVELVGERNAPRILVVDDEPDLEELVTQRFRRRIRNGDLEFLFARDGEHALELLADVATVDMVLSDINMPRMDGLTLLGRLQEEHPDLRSVIVSAYGDMGNIRTAMNLGAFDFLTKPIEFGDLEITIEKTLRDAAKLREIRRQKRAAEQTKEAFTRYFSPSIVRQLEVDPNSMQTGAERRTVTLLFTDLADFTPLVESADPAALVPLLNAYLDGMTRIVFEHDGAVIKIVGDAVRAMFGAPMPQADHAARAVDCALAVDRFAEDFRKEWNAKGLAVGITRIGVNTGPVIIGNFGGSNFFDYTAYGDAMNIAARLEGANKAFGTRICVSQSTAEAADNFHGRPIGELALKGKGAALLAFEPTPKADSPPAAEAAYADAYEKMRMGDPGAAQAFAVYVGVHADDPLATFHLQRLLAGSVGASIDLA